MQYTTIYIVRHGETDWNAKGLVQGHSDSPLNEAGERQAAELRETLKHLHFDAVFSSDLIRAKRTAEIITLERKLAIQTTKALRELSFGKQEGMEKENFLKLFKDWDKLSDKERLQIKPFPDMENGEEAASRFITFLREVAVAFKGKTILVVSHNAIMRNFLVHLGHVSFDTFRGFKNGGYIILKSDGIDFFIDKLVGVKK